MCLVVDIKINNSAPTSSSITIDVVCTSRYNYENIKVIFKLDNTNHVQDFECSDGTNRLPFTSLKTGFSYNITISATSPVVNKTCIYKLHDGPYTTSTSRDSLILYYIIIGVLAFVVLVLVFVFLCCCVFWRRRSKLITHNLFMFIKLLKCVNA